MWNLMENQIWVFGISFKAKIYRFELKSKFKLRVWIWKFGDTCHFWQRSQIFVKKKKAIFMLHTCKGNWKFSLPLDIIWVQIIIHFIFWIQICFHSLSLIPAFLTLQVKVPNLVKCTFQLVWRDWEIFILSFLRIPEIWVPGPFWSRTNKKSQF